MAAIDDVGRLIEVDHSRESVSQACPIPENGTADERRTEGWEPIGVVARRVVSKAAKAYLQRATCHRA